MMVFEERNIERLGCCVCLTTNLNPRSTSMTAHYNIYLEGHTMENLIKENTSVGGEARGMVMVTVLIKRRVACLYLGAL